MEYPCSPGASWSYELALPSQSLAIEKPWLQDSLATVEKLRPKKNPKPALFSWDDAESMDLIQMCGNSGKKYDKPMGFLNHCREDCPLPS